jgi:response regulator RpfG family c-di-GMP phosphodiesterase
MKPTVLYIDDKEANLSTFRSALRRDYTVLTSANDKKALKIITDKDPDVLITNQRMPEMTGFQLLRQIFEQFPQTRPSRIIFSGFEETNEVKEAKEKYMLLEFIPKPWNYEKLNATIKSVIQS